MVNVSKDKNVEKRLLAEYRVISDALQRLEHGYETVTESIRRIQQEFPLIIRRELKLNQVDEDIRYIWSMYEIFQDYQDNKDGLEGKTLLDFAESVISHQGDSIKSRLDNLHSLVVPDLGGGILSNKGVLTSFANGFQVIF